MAARSQLRLSDLPKEVLERVFGFLDQQDRLAGVAGTCKAFCAIVDSSGPAWQWGLTLQASLEDEGTVQRAWIFQRWLARRAHKLGLGQLSLAFDGDAHDIETHCHERAARAWPFVFSALAFAAAGGTLEDLTLCWGSNLPQEPWLLSLPGLTSLTIKARGVRFAGAVDLTSLSLLELDGSTDVTIDGLPSSLTTLSFHDTGLTALPVCTSGLQKLQALCLEENDLSQADLAPLSALQSLEVLELAGCHLNHLPASLSSLQSLTALCLECNQGIVVEELDAVLRGLSELRHLGLHDCDLGQVPALLGDPACHLHRLSLGRNNLNILSAAGDSMDGYGSLVGLSVDCAMLAKGAMQLARCPHLQVLRIVSQPAEQLGTGEVPGVVQALASHATLERVILIMGENEQVALPVAQLLARLPRAAPHLHVDARHED